MESVERLNEAQAAALLPQLIALLQDSVHGGASIGFHRPLSADAAHRYWQEIIRDVAQGSRVLLAVRQNGTMAGSIQLGLCLKENGRHRAEVQKLLVHTRARRQGLARLLMSAAEAEAKALGRSLLYLDTEPGQPAEGLYRKLGWTAVGEIPRYASNPDGELHGTVIFYKVLTP